MTTEAERVRILARLVLDADAACDATERELAAAMADLNAAHLREAALAGELIAAHKAIAEQALVIAALQHQAVLGFREHQALCAEIARLRAERMGSIVVLTMPLSGGRN